jgi:hypothetical protein
LRFHDLRGSHEMALLDRGIRLHVGAARCGQWPAMLLKACAKRSKKSDEAAANVSGTMTAGGLRSWVEIGSNGKNVLVRFDIKWLIFNGTGWLVYCFRRSMNGESDGIEA